MFSKLRFRRPNHATVVAYVALFVALGGTSAYAAATITGDDVVDESLTSDDLQNEKGVQGLDVIDNSLESVDLKNGTGVQGIDVLDGSLAAADLASNAVTFPKIAPNAVAASQLTTIINHSVNVTVPPGNQVSKTVPCLAGEQIISGGFSSGPKFIVYLSMPGGTNGWRVDAKNTSTVSSVLNVRALCLAP